MNVVDKGDYLLREIINVCMQKILSDKVYQKPVKGLWFSSCTPVFSTNKTAIIELKYC
jgi:hypothetical protein